MPSYHFLVLLLVWRRTGTVLHTGGPVPLPNSACLGSYHDHRCGCGVAYIPSPALFVSNTSHCLHAMAFCMPFSLPYLLFSATIYISVHTLYIYELSHVWWLHLDVVLCVSMFVQYITGIFGRDGSSRTCVCQNPTTATGTLTRMPWRHFIISARRRHYSTIL